MRRLYCSTAGAAAGPSTQRSGSPGAGSSGPRARGGSATASDGRREEAQMEPQSAEKCEGRATRRGLVVMGNGFSWRGVAWRGWAARQNVEASRCETKRRRRRAAATSRPEMSGRPGKRGTPTPAGRLAARVRLCNGAGRRRRAQVCCAGRCATSERARQMQMSRCPDVPMSPLQRCPGERPLE